MSLVTLADLRAINPEIEDTKAQALIDDAVSYAVLKIPALSGVLTATQSSAVRGILREQVLRRYANGDGNVQQQSAGPFSMTIDARTTLAPIVSAHALDRLRDVLGINTARAFAIDMTPTDAGT